MVLERFTIFFDNVDATYFPGQQITGKVHVWNNLPKNVRGNNRRLGFFFFNLKLIC